MTLLSTWRQIFAWETELTYGALIFVKPNVIPELEKDNSYAGYIADLSDTTVKIHINGVGDYSLPLASWREYFELQAGSGLRYLQKF